MEDCSAAVVLATLMVRHPEESNSSKQYKIKTSETTLGRNKSLCHLHLPYNNLSKQHCQILIDKTEHFIMDLDSRNKTYRKTHSLRPNTYYELTNGVELTLADIQCQYFVGDMTDETDGNNAALKQPGDTDSGVEETPLIDKETKGTPGMCANDSNGDNSSVSTRSPSPQLGNTAIMVTHQPVISSNSTEDPLEDIDSMECSSPLLLAGGNAMISSFHTNDDKPDMNDKEGNNEPTLAYDTSGADEGMEEGVVSGGKSIDKGVESDDQTLPFNVTAVCSSDAEEDEAIDSLKEVKEDISGKKVTIIDPTVAYELEPDEESVEDKTGNIIMEPTVGYELMEDNGSDEGNNTTIELNKIGEGDVTKETLVIEPPVTEEETNSEDKNIDPTVPYAVEDEEVNKENDDKGSKDIMDKGSEDIMDKGSKDINDKASEDINDKGPKNINDKGSKDGNDNGFEDGNDNGSKKGNDADPTVPYITKDVEEEDNGVDVTVKEQEDDFRTNNVRYSTRKGNGKKGRAPIIRGRGGRRGRMSKEIPEESMEDAVSNDPVKNKEENNDSQETEPSLPLKGNRKRRAKRQLSDDDDDPGESVTIKNTRGAKRGGAKRGTKRLKTQEENDETTMKKLSHDMSDESPDIPSLNRDTPTNKTHTDTPTNDDTEAVIEGSSLGPTPNSVNAVEDNVEQSVNKGRRGRKRKAPLGKNNEEAKKKEITNEVNEDKSSRKRVTRKLTSKRSTSLLISQEEQENNGHDDDGKEEDAKQPLGIKRVKLEMPKISKRKLVTIDKSDQDKQSSDTNTPLTSVKGDLPKVMFTGGSDEESAVTVRKLGGEMVDSVFQCTHLITDKVRRTVKFLCCLSRGCTIVSNSWLDKCREVGSFVPAEPFIVKDKTNERLHKFVLKDSIAKARSLQLLKGWSVFVSNNVKPCPIDMGDIIESAGGKMLEEHPVIASDDQFIVSCEEDLDNMSDSIANGVNVCSNEVILTGVLRQQLQTDIHKIVKKRTGKQRRR